MIDPLIFNYKSTSTYLKRLKGGFSERKCLVQLLMLDSNEKGNANANPELESDIVSVSHVL